MGIERLLSLLLGLVVNKRIVHWPGETNAAEYKVTGQNKREMLKRAKMFFFVPNADCQTKVRVMD